MKQENWEEILKEADEYADGIQEDEDVDAEYWHEVL